MDQNGFEDINNYFVVSVDDGEEFYHYNMNTSDLYLALKIFLS